MEILVEQKPARNVLFSNGLSVFEITIPEINVRQYLHIPFADFHRYFGASEGVAADLVVVAGICYIVDQLVARSLFPDNWTRELFLKIPAKKPERWQSISETLASALRFLTGDVWAFSFIPRLERIYHHRHRRLKRKRLYPAKAVCLFSGGLDSFVGAVDFLETHSEPLMLVGHYDLGVNARVAQAKLAGQLRREYPMQLNLFQARVGRVQGISAHTGIFSQVRNPAKKERTFRSRSIVFLALGLYVAQQFDSSGSLPLFVPENGFIALNPPLTDSRIGSCSTRTAHPYFIQQFQAVVGELGIKNIVYNPLLEKTKGEVLAQTKNPALVHDSVQDTISCAHPTRRQGWIRREASHCGYCVPCLFRRAALHQVGSDDGIDYGIDVWRGELGLNEKIASDLRAVLSWIYDAHHDRRSTERIVERMVLPSDLYPTAMHIVEAGINEMTHIIQDKAAVSIKKWAGLENL